MNVRFRLFCLGSQNYWSVWTAQTPQPSHKERRKVEALLGVGSKSRESVKTDVALDIGARPPRACVRRSFVTGGRVVWSCVGLPVVSTGVASKDDAPYPLALLNTS